MNNSGQAIAERQQYWLKHLEAAQASEQSMAAYAGAHDLKLSQLYQWKTRLTARGVWPMSASPSAFVPVAKSVSELSVPRCTATFPNGVRLEMAGRVDAEQLRALFTAASAMI